jgi:hypothetical protein
MADPLFRAFPACRIERSIALGSMWVHEDMKVVIDGTERRSLRGSFGCSLNSTSVGISSLQIDSREDVDQLFEDSIRYELGLLDM